MAPESIIKRRLKSLRQRQDERKERTAQAAAALALRAAQNGVDVEVQRLIDRPNSVQLVDRTMPLAFYYGEGSIEGRDAAWMQRRAHFYGLCARVFGFAGWSLESYSREIMVAAHVSGSGRDGRALKLLPIDREQAVNLNANAAPLEYLISQNWLETPADPVGAGNVRWATCLRFRDEVSGAQSGGLKAQAYEGGGGGFGPRLVSDYALDCMKAVDAVRKRLHPGLFRLLHMVVVDDVWLWEIDAQRVDKRIGRRGLPKDVRARRKYERMRKRLHDLRRDRILIKLHKAIDGAAVAFDFMSEAEYATRWERKT